jgi:hypothetical protein
MEAYAALVHLSKVGEFIVCVALHAQWRREGVSVARVMAQLRRPAGA